MQHDINDREQNNDYELVVSLEDLINLAPDEIPPEPRPPDPRGPHTLGITLVRLANDGLMPTSRPVQPDAYGLLADVELLNELKGQADYAQERIRHLRAQIERRLADDPFDDECPEWHLCHEVPFAAGVARLLLAETAEVGSEIERAASVTRWGRLVLRMLADAQAASQEVA